MKRRFDIRLIFQLFMLIISLFFLLSFFYLRIVNACFKDVYKSFEKPYKGFNGSRLANLDYWLAFKDEVLFFLIGLICTFIVIRKRQYLNESIIAFLMLMSLIISLKLIFHNWRSL